MTDDDLKGTGRSSPFAMKTGGGGPVNRELYERAVAAGMPLPEHVFRVWRLGCGWGEKPKPPREITQTGALCAGARRRYKGGT